MQTAAAVVVGRLRRLTLDRDGPTDAELLALYVERRDEEAFRVIVNRHGPMVLGVCRRLLRSSSDAEDAFQVTFLVLARRANHVCPKPTLAGWLHGVATRSALKLRTTLARRRLMERTILPPAPRPEACTDFWPLLHQELARLPSAYRAAVVLCDLEGSTRRAAARTLGWPEGTLSTRLKRGRALLARRLARRGIGLGAGLAAICPAMDASASAIVTPPLVASTIAALGAAGTPSRLAALLRGVENGMLLTRIKTFAAGLFFLGLITVAVASGLAAFSTSAETGSGPAEVGREASLAKEMTEWSAQTRKRMDGDPALQALAKKYPLALIHSRHLFGARDGGYRHSAFSFVAGTSDQAKHRNDVQLLFQNGPSEGRRFIYNMVVNQRNLVLDLGAVDFEIDPPAHLRRILDKTRVDEGDVLFNASIEAIEGHVYVERVRDDDNDFFVLFHVVAVDRRDRYMAFVWRKLTATPPD
ncbi:MAG: RNA polymerase sigma factor [Gemmataceae bacterium]